MFFPECNRLRQPAFRGRAVSQSKTVAQFIIHDDIHILFSQFFFQIGDLILHCRKSGRIVAPHSGKYRQSLILVVNPNLPVQAVNGKIAAGLGRRYL